MSCENYLNFTLSIDRIHYSKASYCNKSIQVLDSNENLFIKIIYSDSTGIGYRILCSGKSEL